MSHSVATLLIFIVILLGLIFVALIFVSLRRARYERFRRRYERLHPIHTGDQSLRARVVDGMLAKDNSLENYKDLLNLTNEDLYQRYGGAIPVVVIGWIIIVILLTVMLSLPTAVIAFGVVLSPLAVMVGAKPFFQFTLKSQAKQLRRLIGPSLPNLLMLLRLEISAGIDVTTALANVIQDFSPFIAPKGLHLLQSWISQAQSNELSLVLVSDGQRFEMPEVVMFGKDLELGTHGMPLDEVLDKMIAANSEWGYIAFEKTIRDRLNGMPLLLLPVLITILVVSLTSLVVAGGGIHAFTSLFSTI